MRIELKIQFSTRSRCEDQSESHGWRGFKRFCIDLLGRHDEGLPWALRQVELLNIASSLDVHDYSKETLMFL